MIGYNCGMPHRPADPLSNSAVGVCASVLPAQLPDDPTALKVLLLAQQRAFEAREAERQAALEAREAAFQQAIDARQAALQKAFDARELERQRAFDAREAELHKAFEARILELYEQLRLARRRMFGPPPVPI